MTPDETSRRLDQAAATVSGWLAVLIDRDQAVELRALDVETADSPPQVWAGTFRGDELDFLARSALELSGCCKGIYYTLNPLRANKAKKDAPRIRSAHGGELAKDADVTGRRWILVDFDPIRAAGFEKASTTDAEKAAAWDVVLSVRSWLGGRGWPDPIISDSGNGYHLLYRLAEDLPVSLPLSADDPIRMALRALAARFDSSVVTIDPSVFNPSRIVKFPGTLTCKGENLPDRPWRRAKILDLPAELGRVSLDKLRTLSAEPTAATKASSDSTSARKSTHAGDVVARARAYLQTIPVAVAGQHGHDRTYYAAGRLVRGFNLDDNTAFSLLSEWNQSCQPPWTDAELWHKIHDQVRVPGPRGFLLDKVSAPGETSSPTVGPLRNYKFTEVLDGETTKRIRVGRSIPEVFTELADRTFGWPKSAGGRLFVERSPGDIIWLDDNSDLFGWIEIEFANSGRPGLNWSKEGPTRSDFFAGVKQLAESYDAVSMAPHYPLIPGLYYSHPPIEGGDGASLSGLMGFFTFATEDDEALLRAMLMTLFWGGEGGLRPAFLLTASENDPNAGRGAGKSTTVELLGGLAGSITALRQDESISDLITRILSSEVGMNTRTVLLDNLKSRKFSSSALESLLTAKVISGKRNYHGEGQIPNYITCCLTANAGSFSHDISERAVVIHLDRPQYTLDWRSNVGRFVAENRWRIIGDVIAELRSESHPTVSLTRWGEWQRGVLTKLPEPDRLVHLINQRSGEINEDAEEADVLRSEIIKAIKSPLSGVSIPPEESVVWFSNQQMSVLVHRATNERTNTVHASRYVSSLVVKELRKRKRGEDKGWLWTGSKAPLGEQPRTIELLSDK